MSFSTQKPRPAKRTNLRAFQNELVSRMMAPATVEGVMSQLGFSAGNERWLCHLNQTEEVLVSPPITPVPLTQPWFLGLTNVRGNLYSVIDFSLFLGKAPVIHNTEARLVLLSRTTGAINAALLVQQVYGLRSVKGFAPTGQSAQDKMWSIQNWMDAEGNAWHEVDLNKLAQDSEFQHIGR
ncbi:MAG: chemotaxis protein CheW [Burkholderiales bacterium]|jgi:twitching motility protein PilI|nr:chemotaxis protein CheW [Burkholderiales bacterium]